MNINENIFKQSFDFIIKSNVSYIFISIIEGYFNMKI